MVRRISFQWIYTSGLHYFPRISRSLESTMMETPLLAPGSTLSDPVTDKEDDQLSPLHDDVVLDDIINNLGMGLWTCLYFIIAATVPMLLVGNLFVAQFTAPALNFTCVSKISVDGSVDDFFKYFDYIFNNDTSGMAAQLTGLDQIKAETINQKCYTPDTAHLPSADRLLCSDFQYDNDTYISTITSEFNLVCHKGWFRPLYQMLFTLGCLVGAAVGGVTSDKIGRQRTIWYGTLMMTVCTLVQVTVPTLKALFVSRFLLGVACYIAVNPLTTLALEVCPLNYRHFFGPIESLPYSLMLPILALVAYLFQVWQYIQLGVSVPLIIALLLSNPWVLDESPRWLVSRGQLDKAEKTLKRAAFMNGTFSKLPEKLNQTLAMIHKKQSMNGDQSQTPLSTHMWSLISTYEMFTLTIVTMTMWLLEGALFISIPLEAASYKSPYIYLAILGLIELPGSFFVAPLGDRFGRRSVCCGLSLLTGMQMLLMGWARKAELTNELLLGSLATISYTALVGVSQMIILLTTELFPTTVRSLGSSLGYFTNNIGNCIPPLLEIILPHREAHTLHMIYASMAFTIAILVLILPETNRRRLLETVEEHVLEERSKRRRKVERLSLPLTT